MATNMLVQTVATPKILFSGQLGVTPATTIATVPAGSTWKILSLTIMSLTAASQVTMDFVPSGQTSGATRRVLNLMSIEPYETVALTEFVGSVLSAGDFIAAWSNVAGMTNVLITGVEAS